MLSHAHSKPISRILQSIDAGQLLYQCDANIEEGSEMFLWLDQVSSRLCQGVASLWAASCNELASETFLRTAVQQVGLVQDHIQDGERLYGDNARYMLNKSGKAGLWQEPLQISSVLRYLATSDLIPRPITSYIELGVHTAWTCAFVAAFLARLAWPTAFHGAAIDITKMRISPLRPGPRLRDISRLHA